MVLPKRERYKPDRRSRVIERNTAWTAGIGELFPPSREKLQHRNRSLARGGRKVGLAYRENHTGQTRVPDDERFIVSLIRATTAETRSYGETAIRKWRSHAIKPDGRVRVSIEISPYRKSGCAPVISVLTPFRRRPFRSSLS